MFAKQVTLTTLLIALYVCVYIKFPKEGEKDNDIVEMLKDFHMIGMLTYHEIVRILLILNIITCFL